MRCWCRRRSRSRNRSWRVRRGRSRRGVRLSWERSHGDGRRRRQHACTHTHTRTRTRTSACASCMRHWRRVPRMRVRLHRRRVLVLHVRRRYGRGRRHGHGLTSTTLSSFVVRNMNSDVHARSLGLWPSPTTRRVLPSRRASSRIAMHCSSFSGSKTARGVHVYVSPQLVNRARGEPARTVTGARRS